MRRPETPFGGQDSAGQRGLYLALEPLPLPGRSSLAARVASRVSPSACCATGRIGPRLYQGRSSPRHAGDQDFDWIVTPPAGLLRATNHQRSCRSVGCAKASRPCRVTPSAWRRSRRSAASCSTPNRSTEPKKRRPSKALKLL